MDQPYVLSSTGTAHLTTALRPFHTPLRCCHRILQVTNMESSESDYTSRAASVGLRQSGCASRAAPVGLRQSGLNYGIRLIEED